MSKNKARLFASEWNDVADLFDDFHDKVSEALFCFLRNAKPEDKAAYSAFCSGLDALEDTAHALGRLYEQEDSNG